MYPLFIQFYGNLAENFYFAKIQIFFLIIGFSNSDFRAQAYSWILENRNIITFKISSC